MSTHEIYRAMWERLERLRLGGVFELRTYTAPAEREFAMHARFRDHTTKVSYAPG
jgi:hypothetical protein